MTSERELRGEICKIISEMLDEPGECGIYRTGRCYDKLEALFNTRPSQALKGIEWPEKLEPLPNITYLETERMYYWNACHDAFMSKIKNVRGKDE